MYSFALSWSNNTLRLEYFEKCIPYVYHMYTCDFANILSNCICNLSKFSVTFTSLHKNLIIMHLLFTYVKFTGSKYLLMKVYRHAQILSDIRYIYWTFMSVLPYWYAPIFIVGTWSLVYVWTTHIYRVFLNWRSNIIT